MINTKIIEKAVEEFNDTAHQQGKKDAYSKILLEQNKNELEGKGYDFYFAIRTKLNKIINQNNEK